MNHMSPGSSNKHLHRVNFATIDAERNRYADPYCGTQITDKMSEMTNSQKMEMVLNSVRETAQGKGSLKKKIQPSSTSIRVHHNTSTSTKKGKKARYNEVIQGGGDVATANASPVAASNKAA